MRRMGRSIALVRYVLIRRWRATKAAAASMRPLISSVSKHEHEGLEGHEEQQEMRGFPARRSVRRWWKPPRELTMTRRTLPTALVALGIVCTSTLASAA